MTNKKPEIIDVAAKVASGEGSETRSQASSASSEKSLTGYFKNPLVNIILLLFALYLVAMFAEILNDNASSNRQKRDIQEAKTAKEVAIIRSETPQVPPPAVERPVPEPAPIASAASVEEKYVCTYPESFANSYSDKYAHQVWKNRSFSGCAYAYVPSDMYVTGVTGSKFLVEVPTVEDPDLVRKCPTQGYPDCSVLINLYGKNGFRILMHEGGSFYINVKSK